MLTQQLEMRPRGSQYNGSHGVDAPAGDDHDRSLLAEERRIAARTTSVGRACPRWELPVSGIVFACVVPHGWPLIPALSDDAEGALVTRAAMEEMARRARALAPEVVVIATPHGLRVEGAIVLARVARSYGILHHNGRTVESNIPVDPQLTDAITASAQARGIPTLRAGFGGNSFPESCVPLDWGTMVPAWFLGHDRNLIGYGDLLADPPPDDIGPPLVIVTPARDLPRDMLLAFGRAVAEAASADGRRVAFVASCDWAHAHPGGRYGESDAAVAVDAAVVAALRDNDPGRLINLDPAEVDAAAIDGLWQTLILAGVLRETPMHCEVLSYEAPPNYATGMVVATCSLRAATHA